MTRFLVALAIGGAGAAILSGITSQGYLNATVVTGAGYTGATKPAGPEGQLLALAAWLLIGALAGYATHSWAGLAGLWIGALIGSFVGIAADPAGNILWLDVIVTLVGVTVFLVPAYGLGVGIALHRERLAPDGSGRRPTPPPLWTRGGRGRTASASESMASQPSAGAQSSSRSYARPGNGTRPN